MERKIYSIGIDAGGSKTRACAGFFGDKASNQFIGPGANPSRIGFEKSLQIFQDCIEELWSDAAADADIRLTMGVAGIEGAQLIPRMESSMLGYLQKKSTDGQHSCSCMTDIMLIGAIDLGDKGGLSIILGTGSSFYINDLEGNPHQGGGWGYILGDEGSGYGISRRTLKHIMRQIDGQVADDLTKAFLAKIEGQRRSDVVNFVYQDQSNFHHLVRWIVERSEAGDDVAARLIEEELDELISRVVQFISDRSLDFKRKIVLNGGLAKNPHIHSLIVKSIGKSELSNCLVTLSEMEPAEGAWQLGLSRTPQ